MKIKEIFKTNRVKFIIIFLLVIIETICSTGVTYLMTPAFNFIKQNKINLFLLFIIFSASLQFLTTCLSSFNSIYYNWQIQNYIHKIRSAISKYIFVEGDQKISEIQNNLSANMQELTSKFTTPLLVLSRRILNVLFSVGVLFTFNWSLVVLTLLFSFIGLYFPKLFEKVTSLATFKVTKKHQNLLDTVEKWTNGLDELRRYSSFNSYEKAIKKSTSELKKATIKDCFWGNLATGATSIVSLIGIVLLLVLSIYLYATGKIVFGAVITSGIFANQIMNSITYIAESLNQIKSSKKLRQEILKLQQPVYFKKRNHSDSNIYQIEVNNLKISFKNGESIKYPNFRINKGEKVLLTGDSGSGKSTLFKVLLGEIKPEEGKIIYKNCDGQKLSPSLEEIGYIAQDYTLFPDTIKNNITMFNPGLDKDINKTVKNLNFDNDIKQFPNGIDTVVDLDKGNLSGGQKQKIILSRAYIHNSNILLIDEGTSAIDKYATMGILEELMKTNKTIIMIAHNFSEEFKEMFDKEINLNEGVK